MNEDSRHHSPHVRAYGWLLVASAAMIVFGMLHHPTVSAPDTSSLLENLAARSQSISRLHGVLLVIALVQVTGFYGLTRALGGERPLPATGLIFFGMATIAMINAAAINGFAAPDFAAAMLSRRPEEVAAAATVLRMNWALNQAFDLIGAVGWSIAILCWSAALLRHPGLPRWVGTGGIVGGTALGAALMAGAIRFDAAGFTLTIALLSLWTLAVAALMVTGRIHER